MVVDRAILDALLEGCQIVDRELRYVYVNDALVAQSRRTRDELIGRTMSECYPGIEATPMFAMLRRALVDRVPGRMQNDFTSSPTARASSTRCDSCRCRKASACSRSTSRTSTATRPSSSGTRRTRSSRGRSTGS